MRRRTITFDEQVFQRIQRLRGEILADGEDISFTDATNAILSIGLNCTKDELKKVMKKVGPPHFTPRWKYKGEKRG